MATLQQTYKKHAIGRAPKGTKRGLYAFLDGFSFEDQWEIQDAILKYCGIDAPAYSELVRADEIADEYINKRHIENIYYLPF
jgi:hypothetical protein